jgi:hypothetical protein
LDLLDGFECTQEGRLAYISGVDSVEKQTKKTPPSIHHDFLDNKKKHFRQMFGFGKSGALVGLSGEESGTPGNEWPAALRASYKMT